MDAEVVQLPAGRAVRVHLRPDLPLGASGERARADTVQYFVPVPGGDALLIVSFSTPSLERADELRRRFDAMAATIEWTPGGAPMPLTVDLAPTFIALDGDSEPGAERSSITRSVDEQLVRLGPPDDPDRRDALVRRALIALVAARQSRAVGFAVVRHTGDRPIEAYVAVYLRAGPDANDAASLDALADTVVAANSAAVGHQHTAMMTLDGRPAVRCAGFARLDLDGRPLVAVRHYWIPVPRTGTQVVVWGWTPQPEAADLEDVFDTIAADVRIRR
jgi:hypothetical protein